MMESYLNAKELLQKWGEECLPKGGNSIFAGQIGVDLTLLKGIPN